MCMHNAQNTYPRGSQPVRLHRVCMVMPFFSEGVSSITVLSKELKALKRRLSSEVALKFLIQFKIFVYLCQNPEDLFFLSVHVTDFASQFLADNVNNFAKKNN